VQYVDIEIKPNTCILLEVLTNDTFAPIKNNVFIGLIKEDGRTINEPSENFEIKEF